MRWMMRCSVGVKSRPSTRMWKRPAPPNIVSTLRNTSAGSITSTALPRSGFAWMMLRLVGTARLRRNSLYLITLTGPIVMSGLRRMKLKSPMRSRRAKRSLMISSVGMRPRTMRSCVARLYGRTPSTGSAPACGGASSSPLTPFSSASTSSWVRNSFDTKALLDDERAEERARHAALGRGPRDGFACRRHELAHELLLALGRVELARALGRQQHQDAITNDRQVGLHLVDGLVVDDLVDDRDLEVMIAVLLGEVHRERLERLENRRLHDLGLVLGCGRRATDEPPCRAA